MKFDGITIVSDMDGTLLTTDKKISNENKNAIEYFKQNGGTFTIASGRVYDRITMYADELNLKGPVISHNGGVVYDTSENKVLYKKTLDKKISQVIEDVLLKYPDYGLEVFGVSEVCFLNNNETIQKHIEDEKFENIRWITHKEIDFDVVKILFAHTPEKISVLENEIPLLYGNKYSVYRSDKYYYEILPIGLTKCSALFYLREFLGKNAKKIYAVGDNMNDLELIEGADVGITLKNGASGLKKRADFILPYTNDESAISKLIDLIEKGTI